MIGMSSILTLVMLLLIVVSMLVFFYFWSGTMFTAVKMPTLTLVNQTMSVMREDFRIDSVTANENEIMIYVRNIGSNEIDLEDMTIYLDKDMVVFDC